MKLLIRADANAQIGVGHVMRMIALGQAWMARGGKVCFCYVECPTFLLGRLVKEGFHIRRVFCDKKGRLDDASFVLKLATQIKYDWLVLDGYHFDYEYQKHVSSNDIKLLVLDDHQYSDFWYADIILNQNLGAENLRYVNENSQGVRLLGAKYVLLRKEFWKAADLISVASVIDHVKLLIMMGGSNMIELSSQIVKIIANTGASFQIRVILPINAGVEQFDHTAFSNSNLDIEFISFTHNVLEHYNWANGIITAAGGATWEWLTVGLKAAILPIADNQVTLADQLVRRGLATPIGAFDSQGYVLSEELLSRWLDEMNWNVNHLSIKNHCDVLDGRGVLRICDTMWD